MNKNIFIKVLLILFFFATLNKSYSQNNLSNIYFQAKLKYYQNDLKASYFYFKKIENIISQEDVPIYCNTVIACLGSDKAIKYLTNKLDGTEYYILNIQNRLSITIFNLAKPLFEENNSKYLNRYDKFPFLFELLNRYNEEQTIRYDFLKNSTENIETLVKQDSSNITFIKKFFFMFTSLNVQEIGPTGIKALFNIFQHSDEENDRLKLFTLFKNIKQPIKQTEISLMYLYDRILVSRGLPQIFGTQFSFENNNIILSPIFSERLANSERNRVGLLDVLQNAILINYEYKR